MEFWQKEHIRRNLPRLIKFTSFTPELVAEIISSNILTEQECQIFVRMSCKVDRDGDLTKPVTNEEKSLQLYTTLEKKKNAYEILKEALKTCCQTGAYEILRKCTGEGASKINEDFRLSESNIRPHCSYILNAQEDITSEDNILNQVTTAPTEGNLAKIQNAEENMNPTGPSTWQLLHIYDNYEVLTKNTVCSDTFLKLLVAENVLNDRQAACLKDNWGYEFYGRDLKLYELRFTSPYAYHSLMTALSLTQQPKAHEILNNERFGKADSLTHLLTTASGIFMSMDSTRTGYICLEAAVKAIQTLGNLHCVQDIMSSELDPNGTGNVLYRNFMAFVLFKEALRLRSLSEFDFKELSMITAAYYDSQQIVDFLARIPKRDLIMKKGKNGANLLHVAVGCGNVPAIRFLFSQKISLDLADHDGNTVVHYIGKWSYEVLRTTKLLMECNAKFDVVNDIGETVAHTVSRYIPNTKVYNDWLILMKNAGYGILFGIKNSTYQQTPFHCRMECFDVLEETIECLSTIKGFDMNATDDVGATPLIYAVTNGRGKDTITAIVKYNGNWKITTPLARNWGLLHFSAYGGNLDAVKLFLSFGLSPCAKDCEGMTPLQWVEWAPINQLEITQVLLADINKVEEKTVPDLTDG